MSGVMDSERMLQVRESVEFGGHGIAGLPALDGLRLDGMRMLMGWLGRAVTLAESLQRDLDGEWDEVEVRLVGDADGGRLVAVARSYGITDEVIAAVYDVFAVYSEDGEADEEDDYDYEDGEAVDWEGLGMRRGRPLIEFLGGQDSEEV